MVRVQVLHSKIDYALPTRQEQEGSLDVVTSMFKVFHIDIYALLDPGTTLYFVTLYKDIRFDIHLDVLLDPFSVFTPIGKSIMANKVYRNSLVSIACRVTHFDFVELDMLDFDVILGMYWLYSWYSSIDCRT